MNDCIFCKIINGDIPSNTVYEDETIKVITDINPVTNGHLLVLPKEHYVNIFDLDDAVLLKIIYYVRETYPVLKEKLGCIGLTLAQNNGHGQDVKHFHLHLIPRYQNDNVDLTRYEKIIDPEEIYNKLMD
ncbi:MAG: HIT domain-containing protein [Bacilli bacterium]|nr:HIT domain-containing protein [Bacilli bacterium]